MRKIPHIELNWIDAERVHIQDELRRNLDVPEIILNALVRRGMNDSQSAARFINHQQYIPSSPTDLPGLENGVQRIAAAIRDKEVIGVWGDFDVDGQTATSVLVSTLRHLGAQVKYHIPIRAEESHGIKLEPLKEFLDQGIQVLLTCDTGISETASISYAQSLGIDCIITDHHIIPQAQPPAYAIIDPRMLPDGHPLSTLPGVGVAYKFAEYLLSEFGEEEFSTSLHDLVALGAIADVADLFGDTRFLVQSGLASIRKSPRPSLLSMLQAAEVSQEHFSEEQVAFSLAPRLNAIGRLGDANPMVDFLLSTNPVEIAVVVNQLENMNSRRKVLCDQVFNGALSILEQDRSLMDQPVLILDHPEWPAGVVGIVASRLVEMFHRPVILLVSPPGQPMKGSARSVNGIDITAAIAQNQKLLISFGGHPMAAGMSLTSENYSAFKRGVNRSVSYQKNTGQVAIEELVIDEWLHPSQFSMELLSAMDMLSPYGQGNPPLLFASGSMQLIESVPVGKMEEHLLVTVEDSSENQTKMIWWNGANCPQPEGKFDLAYTVHSSNYRGQDQMQFEWVDFRQTRQQIVDLSLTKGKKIQHRDFRRSSQPMTDLKRIQMEADVLIWTEGTHDPDLSGFDRNHLHPADNLLIWGVPPDLEILKQGIKNVQPKEIYWFLHPPAEHQLSNFLKGLSKFIKNKITSSNVDFDLEQLAVAFAITPRIVEMGIKWLAAEGNITIRSHMGQVVALDLDGMKNEEEGQLLRRALLHAFEEIQSFTSYLHRVDLGILTADLG